MHKCRFIVKGVGTLVSSRSELAADNLTLRRQRHEFKFYWQ